MPKRRKFRDKLISRSPAFAVKGYIDGILGEVVSIDPFRISDLIMKEIEGRRWGNRTSVEEAFNQATLRVLVDIVGRDFNLYDRVVSSLKAPHNKQLASMKLLALGDPKFRVAKTVKYFTRRPWVSSMSVQSAVEQCLGEYPWFEGVRVDQSRLHEFKGTLNVVGGLLRFTIKSLSTKNGNHVIRLALDRTSMEGDLAVLQDYVTEVEVGGLISGAPYDVGDNADAELQVIKTAWERAVKDDQDLFIVEMYSPPEGTPVDPFEFGDNMQAFTSSDKTALNPPDLTKAPTGAADDFRKEFFNKNPGLEEKKVVSQEQLDEFLGDYQRGMHDLGLNDVVRSFLNSGFKVSPKKVKRVDMEAPMSDVGPMRWMEGVKKRDLSLDVRRSVNSFADSFYVHLTKVQADFGSPAFSFRSPSIGRSIFETRPSACWVRSGQDRTRWHFGFNADKKMLVEAALKRAQGWLKRRSGGRAQAIRVAILKVDKGYSGTAVVEIPISSIVADRGFSTFPRGKRVWFEGDPDSGIEGQEVLLMAEWPDEAGQVAKIRIPGSKKEQVVPKSLIRDLDDRVTGSQHASMAERVADRVVSKTRGRVELRRSDQADYHYAFFVDGKKALTTNIGWMDDPGDKWSLAFGGLPPKRVSERVWRRRAAWLGIPKQVIGLYIQGKGNSFLPREIGEINDQLGYLESHDRLSND